MKRDHGLDVGLYFSTVVFHTDVPVPVHLDRNRHQVGQGVGQLLGKVRLSPLAVFGGPFGAQKPDGNENDQ